MEPSVFVELKFWFLIVVSIVLPVWMYLLQRRKVEATPPYVLTFGWVLLAIAGADVYLLQLLASASASTPSLVDNAIFSSELSFGLYVIPVLFGGVGINIISDLLTSHLKDAKSRSLESPSRSKSTSPGRPRATPPQGVPVRLPGKGGRRVLLAFDNQELLHDKVLALLEPLNPGTQSAGIPVHELFSPAFMVAHTCFERADDLFEAGGCFAVPHEACKKLVGEPWDAFIASTTQFEHWEGMLHAACCHWMARTLFVHHADGMPEGKTFRLASAPGTRQIQGRRWHGQPLATPAGTRIMAGGLFAVTRVSGASHD